MKFTKNLSDKDIQDFIKKYFYIRGKTGAIFNFDIVRESDDIKCDLKAVRFLSPGHDLSAKFGFLFNDLFAVLSFFEGDVNKCLEFGLEKTKLRMNADWKKLVFKSLDDKDKKQYLTKLENHLKECGVKKAKIDSFLLGLKYDLPEEIIEKCKSDPKLIEQYIAEEKQQKIKSTKELSRFAKLQDYFEKVDCKITSNGIKFKNFGVDAEDENLKLFQIRYVLLYKYSTENKVNSFLATAYDNYVAIKEFLYVDRGLEPPVGAIEQHAVEFVDKIENCPNEVAEEVFKNIDDFQTENKKISTVAL